MSLLNKIFFKKKYDNGKYKSVLSKLKSISNYIRYHFQRIKPFCNNKPTIAMQVNSMDKGGLEEVVLQLSTNSRIMEKYNVVIITESSSKGHLANVARHNGIPTYSFFRDLSCYKKLLKTLNIKLVHFHFNITGIQVLKDLGIKSIYTIHNTYIWLDDYHTKLRKQYYELVDKFVAVSSNVKNFFINKFDIDEARIKVITNGIEYFDSKNIIPINRAEMGLKGNNFIFLNVTSFSSRKYHFVQVEALSRLKKKYPNIRLVFLGNIEDQLYYSQLIDFIKRKGVEKQIRIINYVPKNEVYSYLKTVNVFMMTSLAEGFSIATLEAMLLSKPMILTDAGAARDVIKDNDIGIVVKHAFSNLNNLNISDIERDNRNKIYHLDNVDEVVVAMEDMYLNYDSWLKKAEAAKDKIKNDFNLEKVITQYIEQYDETIKEYKYEDIEDLIEKENFEILVLAPYPRPKFVNEGWMSRIKAIDNIISDKKRLYITPLIMDGGKNINKFGENVFEIQISNEHPLFKWIIDLAIYKTKLTYCHTLNFAEFILPWLNTGKIIVDIHGVTAEEEVMLGRPQNKEKYEKIEYEVLKKAKYCVMVTNAMKIHYKNKYPQLEPNCIILPIVEKIDIDESRLQKANSNSKEIIYSGGIQVWQNLDGMLSFAAKVQKNAHFSFLSAQYKEIQKKAKKLKLKNADYRVVSKEELKEIYQNAIFGLVFRNDSPVNFVSCPTKLYDYMVYGIIPIVRTVDMGDFKEFGFKYCTENDILNNKFPTVQERKEIILKNFQVIKKMQELFKKGSEKLRSELCDSLSSALPSHPAYNEIREDILQKLKDVQSIIASYYSDTFFKEKYAPAELTYWTKIVNWLYEENVGKDNIKFLDVGSGYGTLSLFAKTCLKADTYAIDISNRAEKIFKDHNIHFKSCNLDLIGDIPYNTTYDIIIMTEVIEHLLYNPIPLLKKLKNSLKKDGVLFLSTPNATNPIWGRVTTVYKKFSDIPYFKVGMEYKKGLDNHIWQYNLNEIIYVIQKSGFAIDKLDYSNDIMNFNIKLKKKEDVEF